MTVFKIDNNEFSNVGVKSITRKFGITDYPGSSGTTINGDLIRDVLGTYFTYTIKLDAMSLTPTEYDMLYEVLSAPQDDHIISMPYAQQQVTFQAQIYGGTDELKMMRNGRNYWGNLTVEVKSKSPLRYPE